MESGHMQPDNAAALVGAGALSVLVFPLLALEADDQRQPEKANA